MVCVVKIEFILEAYARMSGAILLFAASHSSFPEYPCRVGQKAGGSFEFPGTPWGLGKGGKGTKLLGVTLHGVQQNAEVGL